MHARIQELFDHLDAAHEELRRAVDTVAPALRERKPAPDRWSVAEVLEHLGLVEGRIAALVKSRVAAARAAGVAAETNDESVLASMDLSRLRDRSRRITTGPTSEPTGAVDAAAALTALENVRTTLKRAALAGDGVALESITAPHPALGEMNLYQWLAFAGSHEARHAAQIREVGESLGPVTP